MFAIKSRPNKHTIVETKYNSKIEEFKSIQEAKEALSKWKVNKDIPKSRDINHSTCPLSYIEYRPVRKLTNFFRKTDEFKVISVKCGSDWTGVGDDFFFSTEGTFNNIEEAKDLKKIIDKDIKKGLYN